MSKDARVINAFHGPDVLQRLQKLEIELHTRAHGVSTAAEGLSRAMESFANLWPVNDFNEKAFGLKKVAKEIIEALAGTEGALASACHRVVSVCIEQAQLSAKHQGATARGSTAESCKAIVRETLAFYQREIAPALLKLSKTERLGV